jgi:serine/threonine protein kinase/tetratricopeptide (TPR) repeat protein
MLMPKPDEEVIFNAARQIEAPEVRRVYLQRACGGDAGLRARVEALLRVHHEEPCFLESPAAGMPETVSEAPREAPGAAIGPYRLLEQIGAGGFGVVFRAEQHRPVRRQVALKVIKPGMDTAQVVARFEAERQALALMDHPNIAKVLDGGETTSGRPYFVMELVRGVPITEFCDQHRLTPRQRLELFVSVCQAVQHAHQKGIIHRDLKPSNVLVTEQDKAPVVKVIDFGVAKALGQELTEKTVFTGFAQMVGTPLYMSPEQAGMSGLDVDTRSDIYSLGVLLYELLTGTTPFRKERFREVGYDEIRRIIREEEPPKPSTRVSTLDQAATAISTQRQSDPRRLSRSLRGELDWVVMKCLDKDRNRRYDTASALAQDLERYLHDEPVQACPPSAVQRARKWLRRHPAVMRSVLTVLASTVLVLGVSVALIWREMDRTAKALGEKEEALKQKTAQEKIARDQEAEAKRQMKTTNMLYSFLVVRMLRSTDPEIALGRKVTVLDVLANAENEIDTAFPGRPRTQAEIRFVIGQCYLQLGEYARAHSQFARSVKLWTRSQGRKHPRTLEAMNALAVVLERLGKLRESHALHRETLRLQTDVLGPLHQNTLLSKHNLAVVLAALGKREEARKFAEETYAARARTLGPAHRDTLTSLEILANTLKRQGKRREARKRYEAVLEQLGELLPRDHPDLFRVKFNLAVLLREQGELEEARKVLVEVVEARERILGPDHPKTLMARGSLGFTLAEQGKLPEGREKLEDARERLARRLGEEHELTLGVMNDLATVLAQQGQWEEAGKLFTKVLALRTAQLGEKHPRTIMSMMNLGYLLQRQRKLPEARKYYEKALALCKEVYPPGHPDTLGPMGNLVSVLIDQREYQAAFELCQQTVEMKTMVLGPRHPSTLGTLANQALILAAQGKRKEAWGLLEKTLEDFKEVLGPKHPETLQAMFSLAFMLLEEKRRNDLRRLPEARKRFEEVVALSAEVLGPDHPSTLNRRWGLVEILVAMDRIPEAVKGFNQIVASMSRLHGPGHVLTLNTRNDCAARLSDAGKYEEAWKMHQENLEQRRHYLGPEHPDTLDTIRQLSQVINLQALGLWKGGKPQEAEQKLRQALAVVQPVESKFASINENYRGSLAQLYHNLARYLVESPETRPEAAKEAVALAQKAVQLKPQYRLNRNTLALAHYRAGDFRAARATLELSLARSKGGDCRDWFLLAMIQSRQGEKDQARQRFDRAVRQMEDQHLKSEVARALRAEAAALLGVKDKTGTEEKAR